MLTHAVFALALFVFAAGARGSEIVVTATGDSVDGDASSVGALIARPGPDGLSIREALEAAANTHGSHQIRFAPALDGQTISLTQPLYIRAAGTELIGNRGDSGRPAVTIDGTAISKPLCCRALVFVLASSCRISRLRFTGVSNHAIEVRAGTWPQDPSAPSHVHDVLIDENVFDARGSTLGGLPSAVRIWNSGVLAEDDVLERIAVVRNEILDYVDVGIIANTWGSGTRITDLLIAGNLISGTAFPIEIAPASGAAGTRIERTRVVGNEIVGSTVPILIGSITGGLPVTDNEVIDTVISRNSVIGELDSIDVAAGLAEHPEWSASGNVVDGVEISNNLVVSGRGVTILGGLGQGGRNNRVSGVNIVNNTIVTAPLSPVTVLANRDGASGNSVSEVIVRNTIAVRPGGGPEADLAGELQASHVFHTLTSDGVFSGIIGNLAGDAGFVGNTHRIGASSPAVNAGTSQGAPSTDADCRSRVGGTDIGAHEYGAVPVARLTVVSHGRGSVSGSPEGIDCTNAFAHARGTVVALVARAADAARFVSWSGDDDCADGLVTMSDDIYCVATFHDVPARRRAVRH